MNLPSPTELLHFPSLKSMSWDPSGTNSIACQGVPAVGKVFGISDLSVGTPSFTTSTRNLPVSSGVRPPKPRVEREEWTQLAE